MNIFEFMSDSPWLTFFLAYIITLGAVIIVKWITVLILARKTNRPNKPNILKDDK